MKRLRNIRAPTDDESQIIDKAFSNKFAYGLPNDSRIIPKECFATPCWFDLELSSLRSKLNDVKSQLDNVPIDLWQKHTQRTHRATEIMRLVRSEVKPVMSTQAWFKFYEVLGHYPDLVPKERNNFNSVHLCEAPGAFVASLQHYLTSRGLDKNWKWMATTLNPYYEGNDLGTMIDEDLFIRGTRSNWCFGADGTGDLMNRKNIDYLKSICIERGMNEIHLVTCDGSVDCANNPGEQETIVSQLIYCEVVACLSLLSLSGSAVVKMFTSFEHSAICLIFLLCCLFEEVSVIKPVTSKPGNSEVYFVAQDFQGISQNLLAQLMNRVGLAASSRAIFAQDDIPKSFLERHHACCYKFCDLQIAAIESNRELYNRISDSYESDLKLQFARYYVHRFHVEEMKNVVYQCAEMTAVEKERREQKRTAAKNRHAGTLASRQQEMQQSAEELVMSKQEYEVVNSIIASQCFSHCILHDETLSTWNLGIGRRFDVLRSSKFCERILLEQYLNLLSYIKKQMVIADDPKILLDFSLYHLSKRLSSQKKILCLVHSEELELIRNRIVDHKVDLEVSSSNFGDKEEISSAAVFCGRLLKPEQNDMERIVSAGEEISNLVDILNKIGRGQHCLIAVGPLLSRIRAGVLCILYSCFEEVCVFTGGASSTVYLAGWNFRSCPQLLKNCLSEASQLMPHLLPDSYRLLELIPVAVLYSNEFYKFIVKTNNDFLQMRFNHLLQHLKAAYIAEGRGPIAENEDQPVHC